MYFQTLLIKRDGPNCIKFGENSSIIAAPWQQRIASFRMRATKKSGVEARGQISHFWTLLLPLKIREGMERMLSRRIEYTVRPNLWYRFDGQPLRGVESIGVWSKNSSVYYGFPPYYVGRPKITLKQHQLVVLNR